MNISYFACTRKTEFRNPYALSLLSGILLWFAWPPHQAAFLLFIVLVPLLRMVRYVATAGYAHPGRVLYSGIYSSCLLWNIGSTWWLVYATVGGAWFAFFGNATLLSIPLFLFYWTQKRWGLIWGYGAFVVYWISMEYIQLSSELAFPWLNLGNGFACFPICIQWYMYTGTFGGTLWVLLANIGIYHLLFETQTGKSGKGWTMVGLWILLPIVYSYVLYTGYQEQGEPIEVVVVQPNIDCYKEKAPYASHYIPIDKQIADSIQLAKQALTPTSQFLVWPESMIDRPFNEDSLIADLLIRHRLLRPIIQFKKSYPQLAVLLGVTSYQEYGQHCATKTARYDKNMHSYYDMFNSALFINNTGASDLYHKAKLVPGAEIVPYVYHLSLPMQLNNIHISSFGIGASSKIFLHSQGIRVAPAICYEAIYGAHIAAFLRKGAEVIFVISNDGWWRNTPGHQQLFQYNRLRAIEGRRSIARSANTGISGFINQRGDIVQATQYGEPAVLNQTIYTNQTLTFYTRHGDYIAVIAAWIASVLLIGLVGHAIRSIYQGIRI